MVQSVLRWQKPIGTIKQANRWSCWALALAERYRRILSRYEIMSMSYFLALAQLYRFDRYVSGQVWNHSPSFNLLIAPILRRVDQSFKSLLKFERIYQHQQNHTRNASSQIYLLIRSFLQDATPKNLPSLQPDTAHSGYPAATHASLRNIAEFLNPDRSDNTGFLNQSGTPVKTGGLNKATDVTEFLLDHRTPLQKVFRRMTEVDAVIRLRQYMLVEESRKTLHRIVHQRQRIEERMSAVIQVPQQASQPLADIRQGILSLQQEARARSVTMQPANSLPAMNVEQLTDQVMKQIDRRLVIWRERTGHV